jgi:hypothetical protein
MRARKGARSVAAIMRPSLLPGIAAAAVFAAAAAPPAHAKEGVYGGTTQAGNAIVVKTDAAGTKLQSVVVSWRATCGDGRGYPDGAELAAAEATPGFTPGPTELAMSVNAKGKFAGTQLTGADLGDQAAAVVLTVAGTLKPTKASGTLSADVTIIDKASMAKTGQCKARLKWTAARAPGVIYGGATSQGLPLVVRLDATRRKVADLLTTWVASCTAGGYYTIPDRFVGFPIKANGTFGNPMSDDMAIDAGGKRHVDMSVLGRVGKSAAKGTLRVKINDADAAGAPTDSCDSNAVTWKATSG